MTHHIAQRITVVAVVLLASLFVGADPVKAGPETAFLGEITAWSAFESEPSDIREFGVRYLPELNLSMSLSDTWSLDSMIMGNFVVSVQQVGADDAEFDHSEKAYRFWGRAYTDQVGIRLGLQEISFGPGKILRSLQWFDQKDSRDPTGFTDGVNALLFRYYFENNANIWAWTMGGNNDPMGISLLSTMDNKLESGGRIQVPSGSGELGLSLHSRQAELYSYPGSPDNLSESLWENRAGLDLSWDLGVGLYLEATYLQLEQNTIIPESQLFVTTGCDYTFDIGEGLGTVVEVMGVDLTDDDGVSDTDTIWLMAASGQLTLNLLDQLQVLLFHNFESDGTTVQASWQRATDDWVLNLIVYTSQINNKNAASDQFLYTGTSGQEGIRLLFQLNH